MLNKSNKILLNNFSFLSLTQMVTLLIPIIIYPHLLRVLGKETFGLVLYAQAIVSFFIIVVNFGFNISATKEISKFRDDKVFLSQLVSTVVLIKIFIFIICLILYLTLISSIPFLKEHFYLYLATYSICIGEVLFPVWYFQGVEKMKFFSIVNICSKIFVALLIFFLIKSKSDYLLIPVYFGLGGLFSGVFSFWILGFYEKIRFISPTKKMIKSQVKDSFGFFLSRISSVFIQKSGLVIIGYTLGYSLVTYYDLGLKISGLFKIPSTLLNETIYPRVSLTKDTKFVKKIMFYNFFISLFLYFGIVLFIKPLIILIGGKEMIPATNTILILCLTVPISGISYFLGNTILVVRGYQNVFNKSIFFETILFASFVLASFLLNLISLKVFCWIYVCCCLFEMIYRLYFVRFFKL